MDDLFTANELIRRKVKAEERKRNVSGEEFGPCPNGQTTKYYV